MSALGHDVRLIPPSYVKPCVRRQKNDAADAEAICEAVARQNSSIGKERLGRVSKMGDGYLRRLLVVDATSVIRRVASNQTTTGA